MERTIFCVSDHTGLTAESLAHSLVSRYPGITATYKVRPFVDSQAKIGDVVAEIEAHVRAGERPIVFSTLTDPELLGALAESKGVMLGLFERFDEILSEEFGQGPTPEIGQYHAIKDTVRYQARIDAVDFALVTDDGLATDQYDRADVIVIGVSRVGKTPTCLYLSMHFGVLAANYPLTMADLDAQALPDALEPFAEKLFALTIDPLRLHYIRTKRKPDSAYSILGQCMKEVASSERLYRRLRLPTLDVTARSVEEITATVMEEAALPRRLD